VRIVKRQGKYGIERGRFFKTYYDFDYDNCKSWLSRRHASFSSDCWREDLRKVKAIFDGLPARMKAPKIEVVSNLEEILNK
jgi:hypothetical protein